MICELCGKETNITYVMRKYGFICPKCRLGIKNGDSRKLTRCQEELEMYKRYGLSVDDLKEKIQCLKEKNGCRPK
jgi:hypothetical protein